MPSCPPHPDPLPPQAGGERESVVLAPLGRIAERKERTCRVSDGEGEVVGAASLDPSDIPADDWVERYLPIRAQPYARLARLDRPIGTWLLLLPGWWGIAMASEKWPDPALLLLFAIGAVAMRGAGCTLNDIADRGFDAQVARTRLRPLPSGAVSVPQACKHFNGLDVCGTFVAGHFIVDTVWFGRCIRLVEITARQRRISP